MTPLQVVALVLLIVGVVLAGAAAAAQLPNTVGHWGSVLIGLAVGMLLFAGSR